MIRAALIGVVVTALFVTEAAAETRFVEAFGDVPLAPSLVEAPGELVSFATAGGRIFEATARGEASVEAVRAYYERALPALGWTVTGDGAFVRGRDRLGVTVERSGGAAATVRFRLVTQRESLTLD
jgi:hypothetical protein